MKEYKEMVRFLGKALPDSFEFVLFEVCGGKITVADQSNWASSFLKDIKKNVVTLLKSDEQCKKEEVMNQLLTCGNQHLLRVSTKLVREQEQIVGAFCVYMDCSPLMKLEGWISGMLSFGNPEEGQGGLSANAELSDIQKMMDAQEINPDELTPTERREVFMDLYDAGIFRLKGAIPEVARVLKMSEQTAYRYLAEIKKMRE